MHTYVVSSQEMPYNKNGKTAKATYSVLKFYRGEGMDVLMSVLTDVSIKGALRG